MFCILAFENLSLKSIWASETPPGYREHGSTPLVSVAIKTSEKINGQGETCLKTHADLGRV